jgi:hypothetical protein
MDITHVAIYAGNRMIVVRTNEFIGLADFCLFNKK